MFHFTLMTDEVHSAADALSQAADPSDSETSFPGAAAEQPAPEGRPDGDECGACESSTIGPEEADQRLQEVDEGLEQVDGIQYSQLADAGPGHVDPVQEEADQCLEQAKKGDEQVDDVRTHAEVGTEHVADPEQASQRATDANEDTEQRDAAHDEELHIPAGEPIVAAEATEEALPDLLFDAELSDAFNEASPMRKRVSTAPLSTLVESIQKGNQVLHSIVNQLRQINTDIRRGPLE
jgi:hypothetical protein